MRIGLCQIEVGDDPKENLAAVRAALAKCPGAELAVFPEATMVRFGNRLADFAEPLDGPFVTGLRELAAERGIALVAGVFEPAADGRVYNTLVVISETGELTGSYRKIHLFDAYAFAESATVAAGDEPVIVHVAGTTIGLMTCYDVRFPELARALIDRGIEVLVIAAAWAEGNFKEEHWTTLVRARAIENTVWTVAVGKAPDRSDPPRGARTGVGRSLLIDPMGTVVTDLGPFPCVRTLNADLTLTGKVRAVIPALDHRRL
ncbi:carbon-nitrogen hydrolase family protein [Actinocorallia longicatena]|uniref:Carbon-nitrogen hydrolase family protein n=1 Tax=Actinocorallia longicatena TaxID=111803 RepID=A0ABP6QC05_9ACTN